MSPFPRRYVALFVLGLTAALWQLASSPQASAAGSKRRDPNIAVRFHAQVSSFDPTFAAKVKVGDSAQEIIIEKVPSISERDIASFYPYRASDGSYSAVFKLDRHGEATLEAVSTQKRGMLLVAAVNGRPVATMLVDKTIHDGIIFIPSGLSETDIRALGSSFSIMGETADDKARRKAPKPKGPLDGEPAGTNR